MTPPSGTPRWSITLLVMVSGAVAVRPRIVFTPSFSRMILASLRED